jgi:hypothetical protein
MKILRMTARKTLRDKERNEIITNTCATEDIVRWGRQRCRLWKRGCPKNGSRQDHENLYEW